MKRCGFSLIEALVAMAIMGIVVMAFMAFLKTAQKGQKNVQQSVDFDMFKTSLNLVFNTKACDGSLRDSGGQPMSISWSSAPTSANPTVTLPAGGLPIAEVRHGSTTLAKLNEVVPFNSTSGLQLTRFHIVEAIYDGDQTAKSPITNLDVTYKALSALIEIEAQKPSGSLGAKKLSTKISVRLLANPSGNGVVEKCGLSSGVGLGINQTWQDQTSARKCGTTYTNSSSGPIAVTVYGVGWGAGGLSMNINGTDVNIASGYSGPTYLTGTAVIPAGFTYNLSCVNVTTLIQWTELR